VEKELKEPNGSTVTVLTEFIYKKFNMFDIYQFVGYRKKLAEDISS